MLETIRELTSGMAAGDSRAVEIFYRRYFDVMYSYAKHVTRRDEAVCLDVVQDAVLRVVRTVRPVDGEAQFRAWLRLVTQTTAFDLMKGEARRRRRETAVAVGAGPVVEQADESQDRLAWLRDQITQLDPDLARMIEMRFQKRWTLGRIAESLGLSIGTVDGRLRRALGRLRESAESEADDE